MEHLLKDASISEWFEAFMDVGATNNWDGESTMRMLAAYTRKHAVVNEWYAGERASVGQLYPNDPEGM